MVRKLALVLAAWLALAAGAAAQNKTCPTMPAGDSSAACASTQFVQVQPGADLGNQVAETGNFTVLPANCNATFVFNSTAQATVTAAAASGFATNCKFWIVNSGVYTGPSSARGLLLSGISGVTYPNQANALYPGQKTEFTNIGGTWVETGYQGRKLWKPSVAVTFFADASSGSNSTADGLGTGSGANATIGQAFIRLSNFVDYSGGASQVILSTNGSFGAADVLHYAGPLRGGQGNAVMVWNGNGTTTVNATNGNPCAALFDHAVLEIINLTCNGSGSTVCFALNTGSVLFFLTTVSTCNPGSNVGSQGIVAADPGTKIEFVDVGLNFGTSGGGTYNSLFSISNHALVTWDTAQSIALLGNATFNDTAVLQNHATLLFGGTTFNLNGFTVTGTRFFESGGSLIETNGGGLSYIPGNVAGQILGGSAYDAQNPLVASAGGAACASNTVPVGQGTTTAPTCEAVPNAALANASTTVNGQPCTLGSTCSISASPGGSSGQVQYNNGGTSLGGVTGCTSNGTTIGCASSDLLINGSSTGTTAIASANSGASNFTVTIPAVTDTFAMLAATQTLTNKTISGSNNTLSNIANASLVNSSITVGNQTCTLGSSCEVRQTLGSGSAAAISQASTVYFGTQGGAGANQLDAMAVAIGGTFKNLTFNAGTTPAAGQTITITVLTGTYAQAVAGTLSASTVTCTISNPSVQCQDTTHSIAVTAGNVFVIQVVTSATSGTITGSSWATEFDNP